MSAMSMRSRRALAWLACISLAVCWGCGSAGEDDLFGSASGAGGAGGTTTPQGGAASAGIGGQTAGSVNGGSTAGGSGGSAAGGASKGGASSSSGGASAGAGGASGGADGGVGGNGADCVSDGEEACDGVDNDCDGEIDDDACPSKCAGFVALGGRYMVCNTSTSQQKASSACEEQGMRLAWIESANENAAVLAAIEDLSSGVPEEVFIGASDGDDEGSWTWIDGDPFWEGEDDGMAVDGAYANWSEGRPNDAGLSQDCATFIVDFPADGEPGQWNDTQCASSHGALCEAP